MTLNFLTDSITIGRHEGSTTDYPYGTYQDKSGTGNDGTPVAKARIWKDWDGFRQYILSKNKVTPSGDPDTATDSDIADALYNSRESRGFKAYDPSAAVGSESNYPQSQMNYNTVQNDKGQGSSYRITSALYNGGVYFGGPSYPGDATVLKRTAQFDITGLTMFAVDTITTSGATLYAYRYAPSTLFALTGIPLNAKIHDVRVISKQASVGSTISQFNCKIKHDGVTWPTIEKGSFILADSEFFSNDVYIQVDFDPSDVD